MQDNITNPIPTNAESGNSPKPIYTTDWQYLAEVCELKAREWTLQAELSWIRAALENYQGVENGQ
jgi:hypothetical protein